MPSRTNGRRVRVPLVRCCSVRQYAYQDIRGLSKLVRGKPASGFWDNAFSFGTKEERPVTHRANAKSRVQPHLNPGESKNETLSWQPASGIPCQLPTRRPCGVRGGIAKKTARPMFKMRLAGTLTQMSPRNTRKASGPTPYSPETPSADCGVAASQ